MLKLWVRKYLQLYAEKKIMLISVSSPCAHGFSMFHTPSLHSMVLSLLVGSYPLVQLYEHFSPL